MDKEAIARWSWGGQRVNPLGANQMCPDCGSPFQPCKCGGDDRISRFGSTLKVDPAKKLKVRTLEEKFGDDPLIRNVFYGFASAFKVHACHFVYPTDSMATVR